MAALAPQDDHVAAVKSARGVGRLLQHRGARTVDAGRRYPAGR
jgi:hypothetical protein